MRKDEIFKDQIKFRNINNDIADLVRLANLIQKQLDNELLDLSLATGNATYWKNEVARIQALLGTIKQRLAAINHSN
jgi:hypothetical protein